MSRAVKVLFIVSIIVWVVSCNIYRYLGGDLLYFIGNALFIQLLSIALHIHFRSKTTLIFALIAFNNLADEVTLTASDLKIKEFMYMALIVSIVLLKKYKNVRKI